MKRSDREYLLWQGKRKMTQQKKPLVPNGKSEPCGSPHIVPDSYEVFWNLGGRENYVNIATFKGKCIVIVVCKCDFFFKYQCYYFIVLRKRKQERKMAKTSTGNSGNKEWKTDEPVWEMCLSSQVIQASHIRTIAETFSYTLCKTV